MVKGINRDGLDTNPPPRDNSPHAVGPSGATVFQGAFTKYLPQTASPPVDKNHGHEVASTQKLEAHSDDATIL